MASLIDDNDQAYAKHTRQTVQSIIINMWKKNKWSGKKKKQNQQIRKEGIQETKIKQDIKLQTSSIAVK